MKRNKLIKRYEDFKRDIIQEFTKRGIRPLKFEIFGSFLTRKRNPSDIDVLVITPKISEIRFAFYRKLHLEISNRVKYQDYIDGYLINGNDKINKRVFKVITAESLNFKKEI